MYKLRHIYTIYVGTIGHVAHGKSTVVKAISGVQVKKNKYYLINELEYLLNFIIRLFVSRMKWKEILLLSLVMPMPRFSSVVIASALDQVVTNRMALQRKPTLHANALAVGVLWNWFVISVLSVSG
jgi:hypothetical protein